MDAWTKRMFLSLLLAGPAVSGHARGQVVSSAGTDFTPQQVMLNRGLAELKKGRLFLNYPVPMPVGTPDRCSLVPQQGLIKEPWIADLPFGAFRKRSPGGQIQREGKFIALSENVACLDLNGNGCSSGEPSLTYDGDDLELEGLREALGPTLAPGCVDLEFWDGFDLVTSGIVSFLTRVEWVPPQIPVMAEILQVARGDGLLPGIFTGTQGGLSLKTSAFISNTSPFDAEVILEKWNGATGSPEGTDSLTVPANSSRRREFVSTAEFSRLFARLIQFDPLTAGSISTASVFEVVQQGEEFSRSLRRKTRSEPGQTLGGADGIRLGVAGLGSPPTAGEHTVPVERTSGGDDTGVLIVNPHQRKAGLLFTLVDDAGQSVAESFLEMQPLTSESRFFLEYFGLQPAGAAEDFSGTLVISGNAPTSVVTLGTRNGFQQFSLPAGSNRIGPF